MWDRRCCNFNAWDAHQGPTIFRKDKDLHAAFVWSAQVVDHPLGPKQTLLAGRARDNEPFIVDVCMNALLPPLLQVDY